MRVYRDRSFLVKPLPFADHRKAAGQCTVSRLPMADDLGDPDPLVGTRFGSRDAACGRHGPSSRDTHYETVLLR